MLTDVLSSLQTSSSAIREYSNFAAPSSFDGAFKLSYTYLAALVFAEHPAAAATLEIVSYSRILHRYKARCPCIAPVTPVDEIFQSASNT